MKSTLTVGGHSFPVTNLDKVLFPDDGLAKRDLISYYERIAGRMLPFLRGRPLTMHRFPDGIHRDSFYQQEISDYFPDWIHRVRVEKKQDGGGVVHVVCDDSATLCYLASQACITPHVWLSRQDRLSVPDQIVFDLDPAENSFCAAVKAALYLREVLNEFGLDGYVKTTGSHGLHVIVPIARRMDFIPVRDFARRLAQVLAARHPREVTTEIRIGKRGDRVYVDVLRNSYGQTAVAPYAVRALPGAPVAAPVFWEELSLRGLTAQRYNVRNIFGKLEKDGDPWKDFKKKTYSLKKAFQRLDSLEEVSD